MIEKWKNCLVLLLPFTVLFLLILGSVLVEFQLVDILYLIALIVFFIKYFCIKRKQIS